MERIEIVTSTVYNYYGNCAVWKNEDGKFYMGVEDYGGWRGKEVSQKFYDAFKEEWEVANHDKDERITWEDEDA